MKKKPHTQTSCRESGRSEDATKFPPTGPTKHPIPTQENIIPNLLLVVSSSSETRAYTVFNTSLAPHEALPVAFNNTSAPKPHLHK
eukprot:CAMPEP_0194197672 /NCGR_PEP_ID=MMETSP0154-20130528/77341_1 /TAXON_ID=1049557 /ORGANISM="Thalassiothrix antarctica, Strain L6-D1" /LENGTH=85 /DNA_ID=CAMNT_0038922379 /DNA_START=499 /DNA_END=756 /DNA_ORIENTATION=-